MPKILQVIDVNSDGHVVRLSDGSVATIPHGADVPCVGAEFGDPPAEIPPTIEQLNSPAQIAANILSEIMQPHEPETDEKSERSSYEI